MNTRSAILACFALLLWSCQPSVRCDPGQVEMGGGCYPKPPKNGDKDTDAGEAMDAGGPDADGGDAGKGVDECAGDPYDGFGEKCTASSQCSCHAPDCATAPLGYCTLLNCDVNDSTVCPKGWTCLMIPAGASPDPSLKSLCLKPM
ncbi:MAG TPA: hypothetical protein VJR89_23890 [Polyangiales bacterium]|nr:hypothetical protein [Polyangiales bacterium]